MSLRALHVSTRNPHKLAELRALLAPIGIGDVVSAEAAGVPDVEETGTTFLDNAVLKAAAAFEVAGGLCLADDSGLVVDALDGAPGIYSARFSGPDATAERNNLHLLERLRDVPERERTASFVCHLALVVPAGWADGMSEQPCVDHALLPPGAVLYSLEGRVSGRILSEHRGEGGFGYDPLFFYEPTGLTFAEMGATAKNAVSHRGRALERLATCLQALILAGR